MLQRRVVVRFLVGNRADDAALAVWVADRRYRRRPAQRAVAPLRRDHKPGMIALARGQCNNGAVLAALDLRLGGGREGDAATSIEAAVERDA